MRSLIVAAVLASTVAGCSLAPDYRRPALPIALSWPSYAAPNTHETNRPADEIGWRQFFVDPVVQELIALSLANNRDLRIAALNVAQAQAQYRIERASLFPKINGTAELDKSITPGDTIGARGAYAVRDYSLGLGAVNWELDLFGKIRNQAEQAKETFLSDEETQLSTQISLIAQVASTYLAWLSDKDSLKVSLDTVKVQSDSLNLTEQKVSLGTATALDAAQAETSLRSAQASVSQYTRQLAQDMDEIVLLVGTQLPDELTRRMNKVAGLSSEPRFPMLQPGLPSDLLLRRPDIRAAEHTLIGANANIGAARAAFFPSVTLTGNYGTASSSLKRLFGPGQAAWLFEPTITVPIFDAGNNEANLDVAQIEARSDIASYEKAIQSAFHDVADALVARTTYARQVISEQALVDASMRYYNLADSRFRAGADNYLNVLVARNSLFSAQLTLISLKLSAAQNMVTLYKALGGGWKESSRPVATRS
jgi:outer membrane protein, multidrug efflux system